MTVSYDGTPFHGYAANVGVRTVQNDMEVALATVLRHPVSTACSGRTDRGVHARGQVVSFDADASHFEPQALTRALNRMLAPSIAVRDVCAVGADFDARFSCTQRGYRYRILNAPTPDPLLTNRAWHVREPLDLRAMQLASDRILGRHDFSAFSKLNQSKPIEHYTRDIHRATWQRCGETVQFCIAGSAFTRQMVRGLVAMFVDIGRGRRKAVEMGAALASRDRGMVPSPAPPQGLVLWQAAFLGDALGVGSGSP